MNTFDLQRGYFHDGSEIRTIVFVKSCNLTRTWCQNTELQLARKKVVLEARVPIVLSPTKDAMDILKKYYPGGRGIRV